jgi:hypothetical protein
VNTNTTGPVYSSGGEPEASPIGGALTEALRQIGTLKDDSSEDVTAESENPDEAESVTNSKARLESRLVKLHQDLIQKAGKPLTPAEVKRIPPKLQRVALMVTPPILKLEASRQAAIEDGLEREPLVVARLETTDAIVGVCLLSGLRKLDLVDPSLVNRLEKASSYHSFIEGWESLDNQVKRATLFLTLKDIRGLGELRPVMQDLASQNLAFKARRDPRIPLKPEAVVIRENGEEFIYLPHAEAVIAQRYWHHITAVQDRVLEASKERRETIEARLETFQTKATPGLDPYKAVHEGAEGDIFLLTSFPETRRDVEDGKFVYVPTGRTRLARMIILFGRGDFTVGETFEPDGIDFIRNQARDQQGRILWFPLDPAKFDPKKAPWAISHIVWPPLEKWYRSLAIQAKSEVSPVELMANKPGFCGVFIPEASTLRHGPDDLTLGVRGTGNGTFILEEYLSRNGAFEFKALLNQEMPLEKPEEEEAPSEWRQTLVQAQIVRSFIQLAAGWQRNSELLARCQELSPLITVTEGLEEGKVGHSIFHIPKAITNTRGPAHLTCHVDWQKEDIVLQDYVSWKDPREGRSKGPLQLDEIVGQRIPRQPAEDEKPVVQVFRHLLSQRKRYEAWKASQGEVIEEENNGASSENQ